MLLKTFQFVNLFISAFVIGFAIMLGLDMIKAFCQNIKSKQINEYKKLILKAKKEERNEKRHQIRNLMSEISIL